METRVVFLSTGDSSPQLFFHGTHAIDFESFIDSLHTPLSVSLPRKMGFSLNPYTQPYYSIPVSLNPYTHTYDSIPVPLYPPHHY
jgi:hypothetical protein